MWGAEGFREVLPLGSFSQDFAASDRHVRGGFFSWQRVEGTWRARGLRRRRGRGLVGHVGEIEELRHVRLRRVALGEVRQVETFLDELQNRRVIHDRV